MIDIIAHDLFIFDKRMCDYGISLKACKYATEIMMIALQRSVGWVSGSRLFSGCMLYIVCSSVCLSICLSVHLSVCMTLSLDSFHEAIDIHVVLCMCCL